MTSVERSESASAAPSAAGRPARRWGQRVVNIAAGVLGGAFAIAGLLVLFGVVAWLLELVIADPPFWLTLLVLALIPGLAVTVTGMYRLADGRALGEFPLRLVRFALEVRDHAGSEMGEVRLLVEPRQFREVAGARRLDLAVVRLLCRFARLVRRRSRGYEGAATAAPAGPAITFTPPVGGRDDGWWARPWRPAPGVITVPVHLVQLPWERMLRAAFGASATGAIRWVRVVTTGVFVDRHTVAAKGGATVMAPDAWRTRYGRVSDVEVRDARAGLGGDPRRVLFIVGEPVVTPSGTRLQIDPGSSSPSGRRDVVLMGADEIARHQAPLVVVQRPPSEQPLAALTDAEVAAGLAFARELIDAGVPRLILLPAVPPAESNALLDRLTATAREISEPATIEQLAPIVNVVRGVLEDPSLDVADDVIALVRVYDPALSRMEKR